VSPEDIWIEVNGQQELLAPLPRPALSNWERTYRLALGNEFTFERPWQGQVRRAVVHVRGEAFRYTAAELQKPARYAVVSERLRRLQYELLPLTSSDTLMTKSTDAVVNILGFMPFGFLLAFGRRKRISPAAVLVWCAALSLSIEIGQFCFEQRHPSTTDLLCNTLGGMIGAWVSNRLQLMRRFGYAIDTSEQFPL
jgi:VanZ family protein